MYCVCSLLNKPTVPENGTHHTYFYPSAIYHPYMCPLVTTPYICIHMYTVRDGNLRTPGYALLDPKLAVESISEVPEASKAHLDVVNGAVPWTKIHATDRHQATSTRAPS